MRDPFAIKTIGLRKVYKTGFFRREHVGLHGLDLEISPRTVEIHRANMLSKLAATCTTDALRMYYEDALLIGEAAIPDG